LEAVVKLLDGCTRGIAHDLSACFYEIMCILSPPEVIPMSKRSGRGKRKTSQTERLPLYEAIAQRFVQFARFTPSPQT
jgi:hypothetical protein